jgi:hypothetical protein
VNILGKNDSIKNLDFDKTYAGLGGNEISINSNIKSI